MSMDKLVAALYDEIADLRKTAKADRDALEAEVSRAKALSGIGNTIIEAGKLSLDAARFAADVKGINAGNVRLPKMLTDGE